MAGLWGHLDQERYSGGPLSDRPACEGRRWRPLEWHNDSSRPKDMDAYRAQFRTRPPADRQAQAG